MVTKTDTQQYMLTTIDNPYSPFTQYDEWLAYDEGHQYFSNGLLARYVHSSDDLSAEDQDQAINSGMLELIQDNPFGMYRMVTKDDDTSES